ncbi:MAG: tetratricopeptide repeat protein [Candidatus Acidiferrales bacterium]
MRTSKTCVLLWAVLCAGLLPSFGQSSSNPRPSPNPSRQQQIESHRRQAAEYLKENRPDLAAPEFKTLVALDPNDVDARGNLGVVLYFQGEYADAIPQLRAALKMRPNLWKIQALLGIAEKRTGDINAARGDLEKAFPKVPEEKIRVETGMELIEIYSGAGELDKAATTVSVLRGLEPTDETVLYTAYRIYSDLANESLLSLSVVAPNSARMHQAIAHELAKRGEATEAIVNYRAALKIDPDLPGLHFELAEMLNASTDAATRAEAESEYRAALQANPADAQAECRLGDIATRKNDLKEAYQRYGRALELQPNNLDANIGMANVLASTDQPEKAEPLLEHAVELDPTNALAHFRLSSVYRHVGRASDAKHELEEYQKYKDMKEKLRDVYQELHLEPANDASDDTNSRR